MAPRLICRASCGVIPLLLTLTTGVVLAQPQHQARAGTEPSARKAAPSLVLKVPLAIPSGSHAKVVVKVRLDKRVADARLILKVDGQRVRSKRLSDLKSATVKWRLPRLDKGNYTLRAVLDKIDGKLRSEKTPLKAIDGCAALPSACGFPDATNTGARDTGSMTVIDHDVELSDGQTLQNAIVHGLIDITGANVTVDNVEVIESGDGWGIALRHAENATIKNVTIRPESSRLGNGIKDIYGDSRGTVISRCDISGTATGIQMGAGLIQDNYIHDLAMQSGDHVNGTTSNGSTRQLTIRHNTIFNQFQQTDAVSLFQDFGLEANRIIADNLLAGGGYTIYAGGFGDHGKTYNIKITGNRISRLFFPKGGYFGPAVYFESDSTGNEWSANVWDDSGVPIKAG